jgi:hypothetical protein
VSDVVLSPQTVALVGALMTTLASAIGVLFSVIVILYRQVLKDRERLIDEQGARLLDAWRQNEETQVRVVTLEAANERLQRLATDATEGWKLSVITERARTV